eukprot:scaffold7682_cov137-Skeletonema_dohrnii-CCMP3373.AAC.9
MCSSQMKLRAGLFLLHVAVSVIHGTSADEAADPLPVLSGGPRHRLLDHWQRQSRHQSAADFSTQDLQGGGMEHHRPLWRLLPHKQKVKEEATTETEEVTKVEEQEMKVVERDLNSDNDCICDDSKGDTLLTKRENGLPTGWSEEGWDAANEHYDDVLNDLRADIVQLIEETERDLLPKCLRLAFHDCIGGCDGCIDNTVLDNRGLDEPIDLLFPLVQKYHHKLSRGDVWAYCAIVSADMAVVDNRPDDLNFNMHYVGRKDCEGADEKGYGGPEVIMYEPHMTTHEMIEFFDERFGLDAYEMTVLMGVHSAAVAHRENLGFGNIGREDGWVEEAKEYKLSNLYYTSMLERVWELDKFENEGVVPDRYQWYFDEEDEGPIMLTVDMSLILDLEGLVVTDSKGVAGKVMCIAHPEAEFEVGEEGDPEEVPLCPMAKQTRDIVEELSTDNTQFLFDFVDVLDKMVMNGYELPMTMSKSGKTSKTSLGESGKTDKSGKSDESDKSDKSGKSGKVRNLVSSEEHTEHSKNSRDGGLVEELNSDSNSTIEKRCSCD